MIDNITGEKERINPFFLPYDTPHYTVPFNRITLADYEEAMMEGIRREDEQIEKIINNPDEPTFENTIIPEDEVKGRKHYYDLLSRVESVFFDFLAILWVDGSLRRIIVEEAHKGTIGNEGHDAVCFVLTHFETSNPSHNDEDGNAKISVEMTFE